MRNYMVLQNNQKAVDKILMCRSLNITSKAYKRLLQ